MCYYKLHICIWTGRLIFQCRPTIVIAAIVVARYLWTGDLLILPGKCYVRRNLMCIKAIFCTVNIYNLDYIFSQNDWNVIHIDMIVVNDWLVHRYRFIYTNKKYMHIYELFIKVQGTGARIGKYTVRYVL